MYLPQRRLQAALRDDIRSDLNKENGNSSGGGDFFVPFWADARLHVMDVKDLNESTQARVRDNKVRARLYPLLASGFLTWWDEKRRWINEPYEYIPKNIKTQYLFNEIDCTLKIENLISVQIHDGSHRLIYPYFSEVPALNEEAARLGLYILDQSLSAYSTDEMRVFDVMRSASFSVQDSPFQGNERELFAQKYAFVEREWERLRADYP